MRTLNTQQISDCVYRLARRAGTTLTPACRTALSDAAAREQGAARFALDTLLQNAQTAQSESMPVCLVTVQRGNTTYSGSPKHCYYQLESDKSVPYRALFVRMVDKLPNDLGALDYKLQSITTSE